MLERSPAEGAVKTLNPALEARKRQRIMKGPVTEDEDEDDESSDGSGVVHPELLKMAFRELVTEVHRVVEGWKAAEQARAASSS